MLAPIYLNYKACIFISFPRTLQEVADNNRVYRNEVCHSAAEYTQELGDVTSDPTLPRTKSVHCALCGHGEAVFLQVKYLILLLLLESYN